MYNFLSVIALFCFELFFHSTIIYFVFPWFMCSTNSLAMFSIYTKIVLFLFHFFPVNTMSSAYTNTFICYLPIFMLLGTIFILCINFHNAKLNNTGDIVYHFPIVFLKVLQCQNLTLTAHYGVLLVLLTRISFSHSVFQYSCSFSTSMFHHHLSLSSNAPLRNS